ncbi:hypothetical protein [Chromobacterium vaccinii]|uniref:InvB/SpaK family type III secretion system chaperone n=1 Tax=Chromobacterium vaccinii TaxID=1108595 RepID=UPI0009E47F9C|nr:hypothetical protein [Chromobacterium vaccinii]
MHRNDFDSLLVTDRASVNLTEVLSQGLREMGVDKNKISHFDHHSTVVMKFVNTPSIMFSMGEDGVWIWSAFDGLSESMVLQLCEGISLVLMEPLLLGGGGEIEFELGEYGYEFKILLDFQYFTDGGVFANVLSNFYYRLERLCTVLQWV